MYFKCCEMYDAFDRFILLLAKSSAEYSSFFHILSGEILDKNLRNYVLVLHQNKALEVELSLLEYRVSIEDYRHVRSRDEDIENLVQALPAHVTRAERSTRILIIANYRDDIAIESTQIIQQAELESHEVQRYPLKLVSMLRAARSDAKLGMSNIFEFLLNVGNSCKTVKQLILTERSESTSLPVPYYQLDPIVKNGIVLLELYDNSPCQDLGIFLIREATKNPIITHIKPARHLNEVTETTRFVASDTISFEDLCRLRPNGKCHEVIYREDYGLVYWMRSSSPTNILRPFLVSGASDVCEPPEHWLNLIYAERSAGKSEFLMFLQREFRRMKAFSFVQPIDGARLGEVSELQLKEKLKNLCHVETEKEFEYLDVLMNQPKEVLFLIDDVDHIADEVVNFLEDLEKEFHGSVLVWLSAEDKLRNLIESRFAILSKEFPVMSEDQQIDCLEIMAPHLENEQVDKILDMARKQNPYDSDGFPTNYKFTGNLFHLKLVAQLGLENSQSKYLPDLLEAFVQSYCDTVKNDDFEEKCYLMIALQQFDPILKRKCLQSTVLEYLAAEYLARRPNLITIELYRNFPGLGNILDAVLVRHCNLAKAVLNRNEAQVQANLEQYKPSIDKLRRTPLHLCHNAVQIAKMLISSNNNDLESSCLLSAFTPLQMADERSDWSMVDLLLKNGANCSFPSLQLRSIPPDKLLKVLDICIAYNLRDLTRWILTNRLDFQITQPIIYALSAYNEFDGDLTNQILELAFGQNLPAREAPYRFMWGNTALHLAAHNNRMELCRFLVEKLKFDVDEQDYDGQTAIDEAQDVAVLQFLRSKSNISSREITISVSKLDDKSEHTQDSIFFKACNSDNLDLVRYAVEKEGHKVLEQERGSYGLIHAAAWGSLPIVQYLYEMGFNKHLDLEDGSHYTALATAVRYEHIEIVKFLVEKGADTAKIRDTPANQELLNYMISTFDFKPAVNFDAIATLSIEELRAVSFDFSTKDENGRIFLHYYVEYFSDPEVLRFILTKYNDIDIECHETGRTALHEALISSHPQLVDVLLEAGADMCKRCSRTGQSVVHFAASANNKHHLELFLTKSGLTIDDRDNDGQTIIFYLKSSSIELVRYLIKNYTLNVNICNNEGQSILHKTVLEQSYFYLLELEFLLRDVGVRSNITDLQGKLALHYAVERNQLKAIRCMSRYSYIEVNDKDRNGKNPRMLAEELNHKEILKFFDTL